jgi:hypothetical protein
MCRCGTCVSHQMDAFVRRYIHENLVYRSVMLPDGAAAYAVGAAIKSGNWDYGRPLLNPGRRQWRPPSGICSISSRSACECRQYALATKAHELGWSRSALAFLKLDEATSLTGISFPPFPTVPISPPPGSGAGNVGNAGNVFGGDDLEPFFLADWEPLLHLKARRWPW